MLDLCKIFGVEEGEEFKFCEYGDIYFIQNGYLYFIDIDSIEKKSYLNIKKSYLNINDVAGKNIIKLPKKKEFTDDELFILKNVDKRYKWIAKDKNGLICTFVSKPIKTERFWSDGWSNGSSYASLEAIKNSLFNSINWEDEEPVYIDDYVDRDNEED